MTATRLLVVEDEPALSNLLKRYLERMGYQVDTSSSAGEALKLVEEDPARYALVITDLALAEMNGEELLEKMQTLNPELRGLVSSGYPYQPRSKQIGFLQKPYLPKMLDQTLKKLLHTGTGPAAT